MNCVMLRHPAQRTAWGGVGCRIYSVEVGLKEGGFVGPELCELSPGLSGKFYFGFVYFGRGSIEDAIVGDSQ